MFMSKTNRPPLSLSRLQKYMEGKVNICLEQTTSYKISRLLNMPGLPAGNLATCIYKLILAAVAAAA